MEPSQSSEGAESYHKTSTYIQQLSFQKTLSKLEIKHGMKVLDLGCGPGNNTSLLFDLIGENGKIVAIDPLADRIEIAKKNYSKENVEFHVAFGKDADKFGNDFDIVIANMVVHWLSNDEKQMTMKNIWKCLKPGGYFIFSIPTLDATKSNSVKLFSHIPEDIYSGKWSDVPFSETEKALKQILSENGFGDVSSSSNYSEVPFKSMNEYLAWFASILHGCDYEVLLKKLHEIVATEDVSYLYNADGKVFQSVDEAFFKGRK